MPPPPPLEEAPLSELEQLQFKADQVTDESLASTRRMRELCNDAKEAGIRTLVALDDQGEQLEKIEKGMIDINEDMREAEKALQGMENCCCGLLPNPFGKKSEFQEDTKMWKKDQDGQAGGDGPGRGISDAGVPTYGGFVSKITNDAREDEMERDMEDVSIMVGNLRNMAVDMGSEITNQNNQLDRINNMADSNVGRIGIANERARKLM